MAPVDQKRKKPLDRPPLATPQNKSASLLPTDGEQSSIAGSMAVNKYTS
jgi:hypothetical protein